MWWWEALEEERSSAQIQPHFQSKVGSWGITQPETTTPLRFASTPIKTHGADGANRGSVKRPNSSWITAEVFGVCTPRGLFQVMSCLKLDLLLPNPSQDRDIVDSGTILQCFGLEWTLKVAQFHLPAAQVAQSSSSLNFWRSGLIISQVQHQSHNWVKSDLMLK